MPIAIQCAQTSVATCDLAPHTALSADGRGGEGENGTSHAVIAMLVLAFLLVKLLILFFLVS